MDDDLLMFKMLFGDILPYCKDLSPTYQLHKACEVLGVAHCVCSKCSEIQKAQTIQEYDDEWKKLIAQFHFPSL